MHGTTLQDVFLENGVEEFLRRHSAGNALQTACALVQRCFPEVQSINVWLLEDPDEDNHTWVMLRAILPSKHPFDLLDFQKDRYYQELSRHNTVPYHPFSFSLAFGFLGN